MIMDFVEADGRYALDDCACVDEWDDFVEEHGGPVYGTRGWGAAVASYGHNRWHLVVRDRDSAAIVGALPLTHVKSRLFGSRLVSPAFAERGSITLGDGDRDAVAGLLFRQTEQLADELDVDSVSLRGSRVAGPDEFVEKNRYVTFQAAVDREPSEVWSDIKDSRQRQIEQAADNSSLEYRAGSTLADLRDYYRLYLETMRGHGSPPHSFEFFQTLWDHLHENGHLRLSMVEHEGSLVNAMIDLPLGPTAYQWGVVSDYDYRELNGGSWLLWKSLEWAAESDIETYEFGRTREGSGVYTFKKSFGGSKVWYDDLHYFPGGSADLPDPEDDTYDRARQLWRRLPLTVTRIVGPRIRKRIGM